MSRVTYSPVENSDAKRKPGRPRAVDPAILLDKAVELFWAQGFDATNLDDIAQAAGVTKPSLYRAFGDKSALFVAALRHYGTKFGQPRLLRFTAEPDITRAVTGLLNDCVESSTRVDCSSGCLIACVATAEAERSDAVRMAIRTGLGIMAGVFEQRFALEIQAGTLSASMSAAARGWMLVDIMQGLSLRARAGAARGGLLDDARAYVPRVLG